MANISPCGINCGDCDWYKGSKQPSCAGCVAIKGKPFWGTCDTYACVIDHKVEHCGECAEFVCDKFLSHFDPNDPAGMMNAICRAGVLAYRKRNGDEKTAEVTRKIAEIEKKLRGSH
jgi:hypothetical protein